MNLEEFPVTTYSALSLKFGWTLKDWRLSPGYFLAEKKGSTESIQSPELHSKAGSVWRFTVGFSNINYGPGYDQATFQCMCINAPKHDEGENCAVKGTLSVTSCEKEDLLYKCDVVSALTSGSTISPTIDFPNITTAPNSLTIVADFKVMGWKMTSRLAVQNVPELVSESSVTPFLTGMASDSEFVDVTIEVEEETIEAHRVVLAARSSVFRAMLSTDMKESQEAKITLSDVSSDAWKMFQLFLYTDQFAPSEECNMDQLLEILMLSDKYEVLPLKQRAGAVILPRMTAENVLEVYEAAQTFGVPGLKEAASEVILGNWAALRKEKKMLSWIASGSELASSLFEKLRF